MRFHIGCSFNAKNVLKYIIIGVIGLLAFFGFSKVNAAEISVSEISAGDGNNNYIYCNSNFDEWCPVAYFPLRPPYTEYAPIKYINFDFNQPLVANHSYTFDIVFEVGRPVSLNDFEQESFTFWPYTGSQLNDTTIVWTAQNTYEPQTDIYYSTFHFRGQFTPNVNSSGFYTRLTLEQNEAVYGIIVLSVQLVDDNSGDALIDANYQNTQNIINNQNSNTQSIVNNDNSNTQSIISNQNQNTQSINNTINDNLQSCRDSLNLLNYNSFSFSGNKVITSDTISIINPTNSAIGGMSYVMTGALPSGTYTFINYSSSNGTIYVMTSSSDYSHLISAGGRFTFTYDGSSYLRFLTPNIGANSSKAYQLALVKGNMYLPYEEYGVQKCSNKLDSVNSSIDDVNATLTDDSIDLSSGSDFFDDFEDENFGLSGVITSPLVAIRTLNNGANCNSFTFSVLGKSVSFPSGCVLWSRVPTATETIYYIIVCGFLSYVLVTRLFHTINELKDPNKSEVSTLDL